MIQAQWDAKLMTYEGGVKVGWGRNFTVCRLWVLNT